MSKLDDNHSAHSTQGFEPSACSHPAEEVARAARSELEGLLRQRAELMRRIGTVRQTLAGLTSLFGCSGLSNALHKSGDTGTLASQQTGLTNACRIVLLQADGPLRAHQVRDRLRFQGLRLEKHRDPAATVTTILRRLGQYGEARSVPLPDGNRGWEWIPQRL